MNITRITARPAVDATLQDKRRAVRHSDSLRITATRDLIASIANAMTCEKEIRAPNAPVDPAPARMESLTLEVK